MAADEKQGCLINRYAHIDVIRGVAAILVVWMHVSEVFRSLLPESRPGEWMFAVANTLDFGRIGVISFFAVSGFVIPSSFHGSGWFGIKIFLVRRFYRLYPAFWLSLPLAAWSGWYLWDKKVTLLQVAANITMLPDLFHQPYLEGLYWTLQVEIFFYLFCIVLFSVNVLRNIRVLVFFSTLFLFLFFLSKASGFISFPIKLRIGNEAETLFLYLSIMLWGSVFRYKHDKVNLDVITNFFVWVFPFLLVIAFPSLVCLKFYRLEEFPDVWIKFLASHSLGILLFLVLSSLIKISYRPLAKIGEASYSLYLFHPIVFYPVYWWAGRTQFAFVREFSLYFWVFCMLAASIFVAIVIYNAVELPAINAGKRHAKRIRDFLESSQAAFQRI